MEIGRSINNEMVCNVWGEIKFKNRAKLSGISAFSPIPSQIHVEMSVYRSVVTSLYNPIILDVQVLISEIVWK